MRRRSRAGGEPVKPRRRKTAARKRGYAPKAVGSRSSLDASQETKVARLTDDLRGALERETANSEVLRLISKSPGDLELVFRSILENATRICNANFGTLFRFDGENFQPVAQFNTPAALLEAHTRRGPFEPTPGTPIDRVMRTKQVIHSADTAAEPIFGLSTKLGGARSQVTVPMLKDDALIGAILIYRQEVRPFTDKQIELVKNFAAQAVIAIENARLLNELRQSLEQQTATADVLRIISSSPGELEPVFQAMLDSATRICEAKFGTLFLCEGDAFRVVATNLPPALAELRRRDPVVRPGPGSSLVRSAETRQVVQIPDMKADKGYAELREPLRVALVEIGGIGSVLSVPMLKENALIGVFNVYREKVGLYSDKHVALVKNFASQAVIAIENTRLLNELRQSLEQQTATADVLRVISSSPGELEPVFQAMLENAVRICNANFGTLFRFDGSAFHLAARVNTPPALAEFQKQRGPFLPPPGHNLYRMMQTKQVRLTADDAAEPVPGAAARLGGARSVVHVPMLKDEELAGALVIYRQEVRPFTDKQIELLQNFASQAVIAIENTRLLNELRQRTSDLTESLEQQTATSEVLKVISSSPGELKPVFDTILENATRICEAKFGILCSYDGNLFKYAAAWNAPPAFLEFILQRKSFAPRAGTPLDRLNNGAFYVSVRDTGPGISAADQAKLFQEFQQADNAITRKKGGTGLGLAISKRIIEMHGGRIWVKSQPGHGSTFTFTLPVIVERQVEAA